MATATTTARPLVHARPRVNEVVVAHLEPGSVLRVHHPDGTTTDHEALLDGERLVITVPADRHLIGWGADQCRYSSPENLTKHRHKADREEWKTARKLVRESGLVYVVHHPPTDRGRWIATGVRAEQ